MELQTHEVDNIRVVRVTGRVDHLTAKQFETTLLPELSACSAEGKTALLDLGGVTYMSSAGLRVLMLAAKQCQKQRGIIALAALQPFLQEVFRISRFDTLFKIFDTVTTALETIAPESSTQGGV